MSRCSSGSRITENLKEHLSKAMNMYGTGVGLLTYWRFDDTVAPWDAPFAGCKQLLYLQGLHWIPNERLSFFIPKYTQESHKEL